MNIVHVRNVCALSKIFAPRILEYLQFISCNIDNLQSIDKVSDNDDDDDDDDDDNNDKEHNSTYINNNDQMKKICLHRKQLCSKFASAVQQLLQRQKEIQVKIVELVDDLQNEVSDL